MKRFVYFAGLLLLSACSKQIRVTISNHTDVSITKIETIDLSGLNLDDGITMDQYFRVTDHQGLDIPSQLIDSNADSIADQLAVRVSVPAQSSVRLQLKREEKPPSDEPEIRTYGRFVPERWDDFAWENDKVAFRAYGPDCQERFERGENGLISSGIDCWLKRVDYPIINKWYAKEQAGGSYHQDDGEGLDNFHVGTSRGCGGTAIRHRGEFILSENYAEWEVVANGPLRSIFRLKYNPVFVNGHPVAETKTFTIDVGNHFYRCDVELKSEVPIDTLGIGLTLHDNLGKTDYSPDGWISYWEPIGDSELGMGAWVKREDMLGQKKVENAGADRNHIWLFSALRNNRSTYYAGFGWKKAGEFNSEASWKEYIKEQIVKLENPLAVSVN